MNGAAVEPGKPVGLKVIAIAWESWNGWCAFYGPIGWPDQKVQDEGNEVNQEVAETMFPAFYHSGRIYGGA